MTTGVDERGVPLPPRPWQYSDRIIEALAAAAQIHGTQARKGTSIPYTPHVVNELDRTVVEMELLARGEPS